MAGVLMQAMGFSIITGMPGGAPNRLSTIDSCCHSRNLFPSRVAWSNRFFRDGRLVLGSFSIRLRRRPFPSRPIKAKQGIISVYFAFHPVMLWAREYGQGPFN
jgi:hypothetical protein